RSSLRWQSIGEGDVPNPGQRLYTAGDPIEVQVEGLTGREPCPRDRESRRQDLGRIVSAVDPMSQDEEALNQQTRAGQEDERKGNLEYNQYPPDTALSVARTADGTPTSLDPLDER